MKKERISMDSEARKAADVSPKSIQGKVIDGVLYQYCDGLRETGGAGGSMGEAEHAPILFPGAFACLCPLCAERAAVKDAEEAMEEASEDSAERESAEAMRADEMAAERDELRKKARDIGQELRYAIDAKDQEPAALIALVNELANYLLKI